MNRTLFIGGVTVVFALVYGQSVFAADRPGRGMRSGPERFAPGVPSGRHGPDKPHPGFRPPPPSKPPEFPGYVPPPGEHRAGKPMFPDKPSSLPRTLPPPPPPLPAPPPPRPWPDEGGIVFSWPWDRIGRDFSCSDVFLRAHGEKWRFRVENDMIIVTISDSRRLVQPKIHGHPAYIQNWSNWQYAWITVAQHPSIY